MKKIYKISIVLAILVVLTLLAGCLIRDKYETSRGGGQLLSKSNNIITFDYPFISKYVHASIMLKNNEEVENGLKYQVINPKGEVMDTGILKNDKIERFTYKKYRGEWKIIFDLDEYDNVSIDYSIKLNSKEE